jgi:VanZ family protein
MTAKYALLAQLVLFSVVILVTTFVYLPGNSMFMQELQNTGHTFVFGITALISIHWLRRSSGKENSQPLYHYIMVLALCLFAGAAVEFLQIFTASDADINDVIRDAAGIVACLGFYAIFDKGLMSKLRERRKIAKTGVALVSSLVLISALYPLVRVTMVYIEREAAFPVLVDFSSGWWRNFIAAEHAQINIVAAPVQWREMPGKPVARITLLVGPYPGLELIEPQPDWSGYSNLNFKVFSENPASMLLTIRVHDKKHNQLYNDRFNHAFTVRHGENLVKIPLAEIRTAPKNREMDMKEIAGMMLFTGRLKQPENIYISNIRLN